MLPETIRHRPCRKRLSKRLLQPYFRWCLCLQRQGCKCATNCHKAEGLSDLSYCCINARCTVAFVSMLQHTHRVPPQRSRLQAAGRPCGVAARDSCPQKPCSQPPPYQREGLGSFTASSWPGLEHNRPHGHPSVPAIATPSLEMCFSIWCSTGVACMARMLVRIVLNAEPERFQRFLHRRGGVMLQGAAALTWCRP